MSASFRRFEILLPRQFNDDLIRVFVDAADVPESRAFFQEFKERAKLRFRQLDIWLTTYPVEVL